MPRTPSLAGIAQATLAAVLPLLTGADEPRAARPEPPPLRAADSDAPLAEGWPDATRPGVIEVKTYPAYRSAIARAKGVAVGSDEALFFPLFTHISRKGIEMTAPVLSTFPRDVIETPGAAGDVTMEFLYRNPKQGEPGAGVGAVKVEDHPAATFVCLGSQGEMGAREMREGLAGLRGWLADHKAEWVEAGPPRRLGFHSPMTPAGERRWELQLPVTPVPPAK